MLSEPRSSIGVLVVDDHPVVREGLRAALNAQPDIAVLGDAGDGKTAEKEAVRLNPDVIIMDIYMPERDGLASLASIKKRLPHARFLVLTVSDREDDLVNAMRYGADGYILKRGDVSEVVEAVRKIGRGETTLPPHLARHLLQDLLEKQGTFGLSVREHDVVKLLGEGLTNGEIAERLCLSQKTISTYVHRLLQKLHLRNRGEAIAYSVRHLRHSEPY